MASATSTTPDLSLHISLPSGGAAVGTTAPPGLGNGGAVGGAGGGKAAGGGDPWRRLDGSTASTELSLSTPQQQQEGSTSAADVLPWRLRQPTAAAASVPVTLPTIPMDGSAAAARAPIRGVPVYSGGAGGGHPFLGGGGGDHRHNRLYNPYHSTAWPSSSLCSTSPAPAPPPPPAALDPTTSSLLSPSAYHRMLSSTGRLHGVLADTLRGYAGAAAVAGSIGYGSAAAAAAALSLAIIVPDPAPEAEPPLGRFFFLPRTTWNPSPASSAAALSPASSSSFSPGPLNSSIEANAPKLLVAEIFPP